MKTGTEPFVSFAGEQRYILRNTPMTDFDPFQTRVVKVKYETFPGLDALHDDLLRNGLNPLGMQELNATHKMYESFLDLHHQQPKISWNKKSRKAREEIWKSRLDQAKQLKRLLSSPFDPSGERNQSIVTSVLYIGTVLTDNDPRLRDFLFVPTLNLHGLYNSINPTTNLIYSGFFYGMIACRGK